MGPQKQAKKIFDDYFKGGVTKEIVATDGTRSTMVLEWRDAICLKIPKDIVLPREGESLHEILKPKYGPPRPNQSAIDDAIGNIEETLS